MRISILSAVHNEEKYLEAMIQSVRSQTHTDWQLILVSDGSTDRTETIAVDAAAMDSRVTYVGDGSKIGKVAAFNLAFRQADGDLIALLGGDDVLPQDSLAIRTAMFEGVEPSSQDVVAYFKLRTMSANRQHDGMVLPRGSAASRSGGTITLTRHLAEKVFPIDPSLVSEDLWLTRASDAMATDVRESEDIILHYRIHPGNSNPRDRPFREMSAKMADRHRAWQCLLDSPQIELPHVHAATLKSLATLESLRREGRLLAILLYRNATIGDRAAYAALASPSLFWVRKRLFRILSGRRSR